MFRFLFPALGGLLYGYDIGATSCATISIQVYMITCSNYSLFCVFWIHFSFTKLNSYVVNLLALLIFISFLMQSATSSGVSWYNLSSVDVGLIVSLQLNFL